MWMSSLLCLVLIFFSLISADISSIPCPHTQFAPDSYTYSEVPVPDMPVRTSLVFRIKACKNAHIALGTTTDLGPYSSEPTSGPMAEVVLGGGSSADFCAIRSCQLSCEKAKASNVFPLDCDQYGTFWLWWNDTTVSLGRGETVGADLIVTTSAFTGLDPNYVYIHMWPGFNGTWIFDFPEQTNPERCHTATPVTSSTNVSPTPTLTSETPEMTLSTGGPDVTTSANVGTFLTSPVPVNSHVTDLSSGDVATSTAVPAEVSTLRSDVYTESSYVAYESSSMYTESPKAHFESSSTRAESSFIDSQTSSVYVESSYMESSHIESSDISTESSDVVASLKPRSSDIIHSSDVLLESSDMHTTSFHVHTTDSDVYTTRSDVYATSSEVYITDSGVHIGGTSWSQQATSVVPANSVWTASSEIYTNSTTQTQPSSYSVHWPPASQSAQSAWSHHTTLLSSSPAVTVTKDLSPTTVKTTTADQSSTIAITVTTEPQSRKPTTPAQTPTARSSPKCHCVRDPILTLAQKEAAVNVSQEAVRRIQQELSLKESTGAAQRRLTSAPDNRPSAVAVGNVGVAMLLVAALAVTLPDILSLCHTIAHIVTHIQGKPNVGQQTHPTSSAEAAAESEDFGSTSDAYEHGDVIDKRGNDISAPNKCDEAQSNHTIDECSAKEQDEVQDISVHDM